MKNSSLLIFFNISLSTALFSYPALANEISTKEKPQTKTNTIFNTLTTSLTPATTLTPVKKTTPATILTPVKAENSPKQDKTTQTSSNEIKAIANTRSKETTLTTKTNTPEKNLTPATTLTPVKAENSPKQNKTTQTSSNDIKAKANTRSKETTLTPVKTENSPKQNKITQTSSNEIKAKANTSSKETTLTPATTLAPVKAENSPKQNKTTQTSSTEIKAKANTSSKKTTLTPATTLAPVKAENAPKQNKITQTSSNEIKAKANTSSKETTLTPATTLDTKTNTPEKNLTPATTLTPVKSENSPKQDKTTQTSSNEIKTQDTTSTKSMQILSLFKKLFKETESTQEDKQNSKFRIENSFLLNDNKLLPKSGKDSNFLENHSLSMPYTDISLNYNLTENIFFELELELSYQKSELTFDLDKLFFIYSEDSLLLPFSVQWGKFRMNYMKSNSKIFHKKTLVYQTLFPYGDKALGASFKVHLAHNFSILTGWQAYHNKRETDGFYSQSPSPSLSSYLLYKEKGQRAFIGYLQKDLILEGVLSSYGVGGDFKLSYKDWSFQLKTELWKIKQTEPNRNIHSYYLFPYLRWNFVGVGWLIGSSQEKHSQAIGQQFESLFKLDYHLTSNNIISIERVQEYSSLFTKNSWNFAIKSDFSL